MNFYHNRGSLDRCTASTKMCATSTKILQKICSNAVIVSVGLLTVATNQTWFSKSIHYVVAEIFDIQYNRNIGRFLTVITNLFTL